MWRATLLVGGREMKLACGEALPSPLILPLGDLDTTPEAPCKITAQSMRESRAGALTLQTVSDSTPSVLLPDYFGGSNIRIAHSNAGSNGIPHATWKKTEGLNTQNGRHLSGTVQQKKGLKRSLRNSHKDGKTICKKRFKLSIRRAGV